MPGANAHRMKRYRHKALETWRPGVLFMSMPMSQAPDVPDAFMQGASDSLTNEPFLKTVIILQPP